jgi:hypothetical protein
MFSNAKIFHIVNNRIYKIYTRTYPSTALIGGCAGAGYYGYTTPDSFLTNDYQAFELSYFIMGGSMLGWFLPITTTGMAFYNMGISIKKLNEQ